MEEIKSIHAAASKLGDDCHMVADAVTEEGQSKDPVSSFFNLYQFLWRLYYRLKACTEKKQFNIYSKVKEEYWISNYDYTVFKWAMASGFKMEIDNSVIKIPEDKLTDRQKRALDRRCK